jgi:hypothetical protein
MTARLVKSPECVSALEDRKGMPNLDIARAVIKKVNEKFRDGCGNQDNGPFDNGQAARDAKLKGAQRKAIKDHVEHNQVFSIRVVDPDNHVVQVVDTLIPTRAWAAGVWLEKTEEATVGNCGERSFLAAHVLRKDHVPDVTVLSGNTSTSINHDFVVIGATNIAATAQYSQSVTPNWQGNDIVICDPWYQAGTFSYECGIAYLLDHWP